jgi:hypothetical protein
VAERFNPYDCEYDYDLYDENGKRRPRSERTGAAAQPRRTATDGPAQAEEPRRRRESARGGRGSSFFEVRTTMSAQQLGSLAVAVACVLLAVIFLVSGIASCVAGSQDEPAVVVAADGDGNGEASDAPVASDAAEPSDDASEAAALEPSQAIVGTGSGMLPQTDEAVALTASVTALMPVVDVSLDPAAAYVLDDGSTISTAITDAVTVANASQYLGGVEDPWVSTGLFTTGDAELDQIVKEFCDGLTDATLDATDNAYTVYLHISWYEYVERDDNQDPWSWGDVWPIQYSKQLWYSNNGNCYEFAGFIAYCLRYFGYSDAQPEPCLVLRQSGNYGDHGLVFVTNWTGTYSIIDASLSSNGWMLPATSYTYELKHEA